MFEIHKTDHSKERTFDPLTHLIKISDVLIEKNI